MLLTRRQSINTLLFEFLRYCIVGGTAFLCDYTVLFVMTEVTGIHYLVSSSLGFIAGILVNYLLSKRWVFKESKTEGFRSFLVFLIIGTAGLGMTEIGMWLGVEVFNTDYMLVKVGITAIVLVWNYTARKILVFKEA